MQITKLTIDELTNRINEIARLKTTRELTNEELEERELLRAQYIELYRKTMLHHLKSIKVVDENGSDITSEKLKELKEDKNEK